MEPVCRLPLSKPEPCQVRPNKLSYPGRTKRGWHQSAFVAFRKMGRGSTHTPHLVRPQDWKFIPVQILSCRDPRSVSPGLYTCTEWEKHRTKRAET